MFGLKQKYSLISPLLYCAARQHGSVWMKLDEAKLKRRTYCRCWEIKGAFRAVRRKSVVQTVAVKTASGRAVARPFGRGSGIKAAGQPWRSVWTSRRRQAELGGHTYGRTLALSWERITEITFNWWANGFSVLVKEAWTRFIWRGKNQTCDLTNLTNRLFLAGMLCLFPGL